MIFIALGVAAFFAVVLVAGLGVMVVATGSSLLLAFRRHRFPPLWRSQLVVTILIGVAGAAAVGVALTWFGWVGTNSVAAIVDGVAQGSSH